MKINDILFGGFIIYNLAILLCIHVKYISTCKSIGIDSNPKILIKVDFILIIKMYIYPFKLIKESIVNKYDESIFQRFLNDMFQIPYIMEDNIVSIIKEEE